MYIMAQCSTMIERLHSGERNGRGCNESPGLSLVITSRGVSRTHMRGPSSKTGHLLFAARAGEHWSCWVEKHSHWLLSFCSWKCYSFCSTSNEFPQLDLQGKCICLKLYEYQNIKIKKKMSKTNLSFLISKDLFTWHKKKKKMPQKSVLFVKDGCSF